MHDEPLMRGESAHVISPQTISEFKDGLNRFGGKTKDILGLLALEFQARQDILLKRYGAVLADVERLRRDLQSAGGDESGRRWLRAKLANAEESLEVIGRWKRKVSSAYEVYAYESRRLLHQASDRIPRAQIYLTEKLGLLRDYQSLHIEELDNSLSVVGPEASSSKVEVPSDLRNVSLPPSFQWVSLPEIDIHAPAESNLTEAQAGSRSLVDIRKDFEILKDRVLARMFENQRTGRSNQPWDLETDFKGDEEAERVFDTFFGSKHYIYVVRGQNDTLFRVINGLDRLNVAKDLGWRSIPAQVKDLNCE